MSEVSQNFTATGQTIALPIRGGDTIKYALTGTFVGTAVLEEETGGGFVTIDTASAPVSVTLKNDTRTTRRFRWNVTSYTSGTITAELCDEPALITSATIKDLNGSEIIRVFENALRLVGQMQVMGLPAVAADPLSARLFDGAVWYNTTDNTLRVRSDGSKIDLGAGVASITVSPGTDLIQAAINTVDADGGGTVWLRAGTHVITTQITLKPNVMIRGEGIGNTILDLQANAIKMFIFDSVGDDIVFSDMTAQGDGSTAGQGFWESDANGHVRALFDSMVFQDMDKTFDGTHPTGSDTMILRFVNSTFQRPSLATSFFFGGSTLGGTTFEAINTRFLVDVSGADIMTTGSTSRTLFANCDIFGLGNSTLNVGEGVLNGCRVKDCSITGSIGNINGGIIGDTININTSAMAISGAALNGTISGNTDNVTITGCSTSNGLTVTINPTRDNWKLNGNILIGNIVARDNWIIQGNHIVNASGNAIELTGTGNRVKNNHIVNAGSDDIAETGSANLNVIEDNILSGTITLIGAETTFNGFIRGNVQTTDATVTTIATIAIPADSEIVIEADVKANEAATNDTARRALTAVYRNVSGTVTKVGTDADRHADIHNAGGSAWDLTTAVSGTNALVQVTGEAAHTIDWDSRVRKIVDVL